MKLTLEQQVQSLLMDLEGHLRSIQCWDVEPPADEALASEQPFCIDTLEFYQWLQWVFIPRLLWMIEQETQLPDKCGIAPMAEEWGKTKQLPTAGLVAVLEQIDVLLSA